MFTLVHGILILTFFGGYNQQGSLMPSFSTVFGINRKSANRRSGAGRYIEPHDFFYYKLHRQPVNIKQPLSPNLMVQPYGRVIILHLTHINWRLFSDGAGFSNYRTNPADRLENVRRPQSAYQTTRHG